MSYILDAIKKSEAERGHGSIPGLQTVHSSSLNYKTDSKQIWPYILIVLLLLNFAGIIFYFTSNNNNITPDEVAEPQQLPSPPIILSIPVTSQPAQIRPEPVTPEPPIEAQDIYTTQIERTSTPNTNEVIDIEDLPNNIKQGIPPMDFTGHVYSDSPIQRSIIINGKFLEEGDFLNSNILLNEITKKGAIFNFKGTLFSVNVLTGWSINQ